MRAKRGVLLLAAAFPSALAACSTDADFPIVPLEPPAPVSVQAGPAEMFIVWGPVDGALDYEVQIRDLQQDNVLVQLVNGTSLERGMGIASGREYEVVIEARVGSRSVGSPPVRVVPLPIGFFRQQADLVLTTSLIGANFGAALAAGDENGDGYADLAVGAPRRQVAAAGTVTLFQGGPAGLSSSAAWMLTSGAEDRFGHHVAMGNLDDDPSGRDDIAISFEAASARGMVGVWISDVAGPQMVMLSGGNGSSDGYGFRTAIGDIDGNGSNDLVVSGGGRLDVYRGSLDGNPFPVTRESVLVDLQQEATSGLSLDLADVNGDTACEILAGSPGKDSPYDEQGVVRTFEGVPGGLFSATPSDTLEGTLVQPGANVTGYHFGIDVAFADADGDGTLDLVVGADGQGGATDPDDEGEVDILLTDGTSVSGYTNIDWWKDGANGTDRIGKQVERLGNLDGEPGDEIAVAGNDAIWILAPADDFGSSGSGASGGGASGGGNDKGEDPVEILDGNNPDVSFGDSMVAADFNGDGRRDLAVGADGADSETGRVYVWYSTRNYGPLADAGAPQVREGGANVSMNGSFVDPITAESWTCTWDWDDGTQPTVVSDCLPANAGGVQHKFDKKGRHHVKLTVTASDGRTGESVTVIRID